MARDAETLAALIEELRHHPSEDVRERLLRVLFEAAPSSTPRREVRPSGPSGTGDGSTDAWADSVLRQVFDLVGAAYGRQAHWLATVAVETFAKAAPEQVPRFHAAAALTGLSAGELNEAFDSAVRAMVASGDALSPMVAASTLNSIGTFFERLGAWDLAISQYDAALDALDIREPSQRVRANLTLQSIVICLHELISDHRAAADIGRPARIGRLRAIMAMLQPLEPGHTVRYATLMAAASLALAVHDGPEAIHAVQQMERLRDTMVHREELAWRMIGAAAMRTGGRLLEAERWATAALTLSLEEDGFRTADGLRARAAIRWDLGDENLAFADSMDAIESMASTRADRIIVLAAGLADKAMLERARQQLTDQSASLAITAARDPLSGLANRRGLDEVVGLLAHSDQSAVVVVVDIDHFKSVNDTFGHEVGDGVIRACADVLREVVGRASLIARLGGDEFVIVVVDGKTKPVPLGERLCASVRARDWQSLAPGLAVTVSVGVTVGAARHLRDLIAHADMAMYHAKQGGRDGMEFAERRRGRARG